MNAEQSLALAISIILCICLTINSVILVRDRSIYTSSVESWQNGLGTRLTTMIIMWFIWLVITFVFVPWFDSTKEQVQSVTDGAELLTDDADQTVGVAVDEVSP